MQRITIPANQIVKEGQFMEVLVNGISVFLKAKWDTSSASYHINFWSSEFDRGMHGFSGINDDLEALCNLMK